MPRLLILTSILLAASQLPHSPQDEGAPSEPPRSGLNVKRLMKSCRKCHMDVMPEWERSRHAQAWKSPVFQAAIATLPDEGESCARCHAPDSVVLTGPGKLPHARKEHRDLGVNCTTCHMDGKKYFGPFASKGHGGIVVLGHYKKALFCSSCHGQPEVNEAHDQYSSFLTSPAHQDGGTCQECHMPEVEREMVKAKRKLRNTQPARACRVHTFEGAHSGGMARDAAFMAGELDGSELILKIEPYTGHSFPASEGRVVRVEAAFLDAEGTRLGVGKKVFDSAKKDVLRPGQENAVRLKAPPGTVKASVSMTLVLVKAPGRPAEKVLPVTSVEVVRP